MTSASVIVINWNGAAFLNVCLESLLAEAAAEDEIIVVDNASTDNSVELVRSHFPDVRLLCNKRNLGYAGGANVGLRAARGDVLILLNPDVQVHAGWLITLKDTLKDKIVGIAGCKLLYPGDEIIQHAGGIINFPLALADHYGYRQRDDGQWDQEREVDYVTGAAFALRRDILNEVGFFDEKFYPAYYEEADLCFRVRGAGYRILYAPGAVATHYEHALLEERSCNYLHFFHRNRLRFVLKHLSPGEFISSSVPAERERLAQGLPLNERRALSCAYLLMMMAYPDLYLDYWGGELDQMNAVVGALGELRAQVWKT
jgi:GT2 family glycosyltransferase